MKIVLEINGMHCNGCVSRVERIVNAQEGVNEVKVSLEDKKAYISCEDNTNISEIINSIKDIGFDAKEIKC